MARVKTFTNGGSLLPGDLNAIQDDYELAFSRYKLVRSGALGGTTLTTTPALLLFNGAYVGGGNNGYAASYLNPADYAASPRTTKLRLVVWLAVNQVAPGVNIEAQLYPVTPTFGASGVADTYAVGAAVAGSTVLFTAPSASSTPTANSGDFNMPAAGLYAVGFSSVGASTSANSRLDFGFDLQLRQV